MGNELLLQKNVQNVSCSHRKELIEKYELCLLNRLSFILKATELTAYQFSEHSCYLDYGETHSHGILLKKILLKLEVFFILKNR